MNNFTDPVVSQLDSLFLNKSQILNPNRFMDSDEESELSDMFEANIKKAKAKIR